MITASYHIQFAAEATGKLGRHAVQQLVEQGRSLVDSLGIWNTNCIGTCMHGRIGWRRRIAKQHWIGVG